MDATARPAPVFPPGFAWGAATAAYQVEGSPLADGAGESIWHRFSHTPGAVANGDTGDHACDHLRLHRQDVRLMRDLGLRSYRFSVAWPRVMPEGRGRVNAAGLDFYDRLVDALLEAGIDPFVTLYHWDLPAALQDLGGWTNRDVAAWFGDYAAQVYRRLGDRVRHWITLNEPWVVAHMGHVQGDHAPGLRDLRAGLSACHNLLRAHGAAVARFRAAGTAGEVGVAVNLSPQEPGGNSAADLLAAQCADAYVNRMFLDPIFTGKYPSLLEERLAGAWPAVLPGDMEEISAPIDFVGINYYSCGTVVADPGRGQLGYAELPARPPLTGMGSPIQPQGLRRVLTWVHTRYGAPPLYVTENGAAFADVVDSEGRVDDAGREEYLAEHVRAAALAVADGVDLRGYFVWSLMDNFEWSLGYGPRFGLVHVDFDDPKRTRTVKRSGRWYADLIARNGTLPGRGGTPAGEGVPLTGR